MFKSINSLFKKITDKNRKMISEDVTNFDDTISGSNFSKITACLDHLDRFYYNLDRMVQDNPKKSLDDIMTDIEWGEPPQNEANSPSGFEGFSPVKNNTSGFKTDRFDQAVGKHFQELFKKQDLEYQKLLLLGCYSPLH